MVKKSRLKTAPSVKSLQRMMGKMKLRRRSLKEMIGHGQNLVKITKFKILKANLRKKRFNIMTSINLFRKKTLKNSQKKSPRRLLLLNHGNGPNSRKGKMSMKVNSKIKMKI